MNKIFILSLILLAALPVRVQAQSGEPLVITADGALEWDRNNQTFTATQNALAIQGDASISANTLHAEYSETGDNGLDISVVTATGSVILTSADNKVFGDKAVYDLNTGQAIVTGQDLRMTSPQQTITASERFEYDDKLGLIKAIGNARAVRPKPDGSGVDTLEADTLSATLENTQQGERALKTMEAEGNVVITTPTERITGAYGRYTAATNTAELTGGVTIKRGPNVLEGERATVNLTTNTSQLFGGQSSPAGQGRVRGVFYPGSETSEGSRKDNIE